MLEAARAVGARVVFASTGGAGYGEYEGLPVPSPETAETRPLSHYGMSKMAGEGYLRLYARLYDAETVVLRLGNVYGPRQDPHGEAGVVAIFCGRLLDGERPTVFGDGLQTRDYVYVGDVVRAFIAAETGPGGRDDERGLRRRGERARPARRPGLRGEDPEFAPARAGELQRSALDVAKAGAGAGLAGGGRAGRRPGRHPRVGCRGAPGARRTTPRGLLPGVSRGGRTGRPSSTAAGPSSTIQREGLRVDVDGVRGGGEPLLQRRAAATARPSGRPRR